MPTCFFRVSLPKLSSSIKLAAKVFSEIGNAQVIRCWSGIEGYTPDELPIIGRGRQNGLFHGFGFSAHGFQLGPGVGEALAELVMGQQPRVSLEAFRPDSYVHRLLSGDGAYAAGQSAGD